MLDNTNLQIGNYKPIRIAQIMGKLWAGGVENVVFNYYREIDKREIQFDFYYDDDSTMAPPEDLIEMGAGFYSVPAYQNLWKYLGAMKTHFRQHKYIIVHSHINSLSVFPLFIAWTERIPVRIAHNHSVPGGNEKSKNLLKSFLKKFSKIFSTEYFACSEKSGRWLFGDECFEKGQVTVIKNALDFSKFTINEKDRQILAKNLGVEDKFVVGHVGRFTYAKNHRFLLKIFKEIKISNASAVLLLVGDGELHQQIVDEVKKMGLCDSVILIGKTKEPEKYYQLMDVLILPSIFEGFSITTIEAQMSLVPTVVSDVVSEEANISNSCKYLSLATGAGVWAKTALEMAQKDVFLTSESYKYDIKENAPNLKEWYIGKYELNCRKENFNDLCL